jgi:hypothetical protein
MSKLVSIQKQIQKQTQKQKQKQKRHFYTAEEIIPLWNKYITEQLPQWMVRTRSANRLNINDQCKCVVAEAYGFSDKYDTRNILSYSSCKCSKCTDFAYNGFLDYYFITRETANSFVKHMNDHHYDQLVGRLGEK